MKVFNHKSLTPHNYGATDLKHDIYGTQFANKPTVHESDCYNCHGQITSFCQFNIAVQKLGNQTIKTLR